jgi:tetratricopeptide (TPR) repeat protein
MRVARKTSRWSVAGVLLGLTLFLVANGAYLAAFGTPDIFYIANSLLHPVVGVIAVVFFLALLARAWRAFEGFYGRGAVLLLGLSAAFGVYLAVVGMTRPHRLALYAHVGLVIPGLFLLLAYLRSLAERNSQPERADPRNLDSPVLRFSRRAYRWSAVVMMGSALFYGGAVLYDHFFSSPRYTVRNPSTPPLSMDDEGGRKLSFMFPSSARTPDGKPIRSEFFMDSESCKRCHTDIYTQWQSSMHHFASFNNQWYRKAIEYMQDTIGIKSSLWCGGCHDHALIVAGTMQTHPIREIENTPAGQNGLGCMSCHAIVHVGSTMGQGDFVMEYPALTEYAASKNPVLRYLHDYDVKVNPKPHRNAFLKPFHRQPQQVAQFCSACHKVHLDVPVNNYRWIRGFDDYDNWQASGVSGLGARSFYYPPKPYNCADCHMPLVPSKDQGNISGFVHSHRFAAANAAVPTSQGDGEQVEAVESFLRGALSVDIFALAEEPAGAEQIPRRGRTLGETPQLASTFAVGEESSSGLAGGAMSVGQPAKLMAPLGRAEGKLWRGQTVRVEVVVRTRKVGHFFPAGTVDAFDCWLELQARDNKGRVIYWSGKAADDGKGPVEPGAHFYRSLQLDAHGNMINKRNAWSTRAVMYAHLIPPGAADTAHFRLQVPIDAGDTITLTAKLNYRKFSWWNTQWAFAGIRDPSQPDPHVTKSYDDGHWVFQGDLSQVSAKYKQIPDVPTVVIAEDTVTLPVVGPPPSGLRPHGGVDKNAIFEESVTLDPRDRERWNDYGIGLLLQGDLKGAERAFKKVTEIDPKYADGWVNVARARVQEGNTDAAKPELQKALELNPQLASAHYFYGLALKSDGDYAEAYNQFALAAARYPNDRVNRNQMGRMLFLQRKYKDAIAQLQRTLSVDPEDLEAHYNLMLCYRGLNDDALAGREERLYLRFKADEASRAITGAFALQHPEDNNEAQPIHEHVSIALEERGGQYASFRSQTSGVESARAQCRGRACPTPLRVVAGTASRTPTSSRAAGGGSR